MKKFNNFGFSFIELLVGITISTILMLSIGIFVSSGIKNINIQTKILNQSQDVSNFNLYINNILSENIEVIENTMTSVLLKSNYILGNPNIYLIEQKTKTGFCQNQPDLEIKVLNIKNFNFFKNNSYSYSGDYLKHLVYSGGQVVAGRGIFGDFFQDGLNGTGIYLNNPTGITFGENKLFISDTANNKILYLSGGNIYKLFDENDGIFHPTGLLYHNNTLFIANNGRNEILSYSSSGVSTPNNLKINLLTNNNINNVNALIFEFKEGINNINITSPTNSGSFSFSGFTKNTGDFVNIGTGLIYNFSGSSINFSSGTNYEITINNLSGSFLNNGNYYIKLTLSGSTKPNFYFPFFTKSDNDLITKSDNILKNIYSGSGKYGNFGEIYLSGSNIIVNDYLNKTFLRFDFNGNFISSGSLNYNIDIFDFKEFNPNLIIKDFKVEKTGNLLNLKIDYYKNFDCYDETQNIIKTLIFKKLSN